MSCWLIVELKRLVIEISQFAYSFVGDAHQVGNGVELFLLHGCVVDDNGIVKVSTLNEIVLYKR